MKYTLNLKYNIGDTVKYIGTGYHYCYNNSWNKIPDEENNWKIDAYSVAITEDGIEIKYCFHAYCSKYFEYHDLIKEEELEPIGETHPITIEWEPKDVFGNPIEFGDMAYYSFYSKSRYSDTPNVPKVSNFMAFEERGIVKEFIRSNNVFGRQDESLRFEQLYENEDYRNSYGYVGGPMSFIEGINGVIIKAPETFVEDMARMGMNSYLDADYNMKKFKRITGWFGLADECVARYEELKAKKEKRRQYRANAKKKKKTKAKFDAEKILNGLSAKEKMELLNALQNS